MDVIFITYKFSTVNRRCMFPTKVKNIEMIKDLSITVDVLSLHYDPEIWNEPEKFDPLRFVC
jgi:cytochrome P450